MHLWLHHKNTLWEESTKIPFIISHPKYGKSKGKIIENPVPLIDVFPTIADFTDSKSSNLKNNKGKKLDGFSLKLFLENPENPEWNGPEVALTVVRGNSKSNDSKEQSYAVRSKNFRYIHYVNGKEELYDHKKDPYEWNNLASDKNSTEIKADLKNQLYKLLEKK